ncbi:MAG TPA: DUF4430 domain-containing protein [Acidobacteriota bacterium]|nr:DUF4430 domain-containing protein [Acidobacteriota bacterium]
MRFTSYAAPIVLLSALLSCQTGGEAPQTVRSLAQPGALVIAYTPDSADTFVAVGADSVVILDWLRAAAGSAGLTLDLEEYSFGTMVTGIGPRRNGEGGYWLYLVNGQSVPKAASDCRVAASDTVRFFFDER